MSSSRKDTIVTDDNAYCGYWIVFFIFIFILNTFSYFKYVVSLTLPKHKEDMCPLHHCHHQLPGVKGQCKNSLVVKGQRKKETTS